LLKLDKLVSKFRADIFAIVDFPALSEIASFEASVIDLALSCFIAQGSIFES
jgi:hypothetical protein